jgi:hypothetical protein
MDEIVEKIVTVARATLEAEASGVQVNWKAAHIQAVNWLSDYDSKVKTETEDE